MPRNRIAKPTLGPPKSGVTIRMYNPGFGDCFLLAFRKENGDGLYMLIDCGVHHQYKGGSNRIGLVANDILEATGKHLDIVIATHEHTDHLYGFKYARKVFNRITIGDLWLAWTEDPTNPDVKRMKSVRKERTMALQAAISRLKPVNQPLSEALQAVLDFETPHLAAAKETIGELDYLRKKSISKPQEPKDYLRPGEPPRIIPGVKGPRVYVLGPPQEAKLIRKTEDEGEMYPEFAFMDELGAFAAALTEAPADSSEEDPRFRRSCPFEKALEIRSSQAGGDDTFGHFFRKYYGFTSEKEEGPEWRRIDNDWLAAAEKIALRLNDYTNNTSLVLAIELTNTKPRKVLLFAADAQVGSWLSWQKLSWPGERPGEEGPNVADLLQRTVFYKVGHHGSRNATLCQKGLEMMQSPDLVAMIPVDEDWAKDVQDWEHPATKLLDRLEQKTMGRIIRSDRIPSAGHRFEKPHEANDEEWKGFKSQLSWDQGPDKLWIQYTVPG